MSNKVLIVEDERAIVEILKFNLTREGYETLEALDGETGLKLGREADPDLILLDVMLPKLGGFELCKTLRSEGRAVPIIMLTAREEENDKIFGLEAGADDYITKPFSMRELLARVKANIRRRVLDVGDLPAPAEASGELVLNPDSYAVYKNGAPVELTQKEFDLLRFLMAAPDKVFSREELLEQVWKYGYFGDMRTVDVTIRRLREKIEDTPGKPRYIMTRRGVGYYFSQQ
ncbi:MAG: response regulator transcription factor [Oscillospiraceae bacterium]|nr:response regulator transcription factor [Oscillospiraceae bacterium]